MKRLPIANGQWPINGSSAGRRFTGGRHAGSQGVGFSEQGGQFLSGDDFGFNQQFEPQCRLVGFFLNGADFRNEFRPASCAARGTIIRGHRSSTSHNLFGNDACCVVIPGNGAGQFDDAQGKGLGAGFQLGWAHVAKLQTQSATSNRQSAITK